MDDVFETQDIQKVIRQKKFIKNNGSVLRNINMLRERFIPLRDLFLGLEDNLNMNESEFIDCVNYLSMSGYIQLRKKVGKQEADLSDTNYQLLEGKLSEKGVQLIAGAITDVCIEL